MKSLLFVATALLAGTAACHHSKSSDTMTPPPSNGSAAGDGTMAEDDGPPTVDPTLPSWSPQSCRAYHTAVVSAISCDDLAKDKRDAIKAKYDSAHDSWQAMQNVPPETIDQIRMLCRESAKSVRADKGDLCPNNTTPVPPAK